jgi:hypothetical protein
LHFPIGAIAQQNQKSKLHAHQKLQITNYYYSWATICTQHNKKQNIETSYNQATYKWKVHIVSRKIHTCIHDELNLTTIPKPRQMRSCHYNIQGNNTNHHYAS